jgi:hypothetical protein
LHQKRQLTLIQLKLLNLPSEAQRVNFDTAIEWEGKLGRVHARRIEYVEPSICAMMYLNVTRSVNDELLCRNTMRLQIKNLAALSHHVIHILIGHVARSTSIICNK